MASGFFAILDDIAALMDDVAVISKVATKKTAGILGDDLAVNAEKATGFLESREVPVLMKIMKGSFINKLIIVPFVFLLQWLYEPAISIVLLIGGFYLAYEGVEKIIEFLFHKKEKKETLGEEIQDIIEPSNKGELAEKKKINSAIKTDFILSLEIIIIALAAAKDEFVNLKPQYDQLLVEILVVSAVAIIATFGVYGIVALIVRMDDFGYRLIKKSNEKGMINQIGIFLVYALPWVIKGIGVVGTIALILVAGGIFDHNIGFLHHQFTNFPEMIKHIIYGIVGGLIAIPIFMGLQKVIEKTK